MTEIIKTKEDIETNLKVIAGSEEGSEIRSLKIKNKLEGEIHLEIIAVFTPVLSKAPDDISHPAFNNLFLKYDMNSCGDLIVKRNRNVNMCLGTSLNLQTSEKSNFEYEIDGSRVYDMIKNGEKFSSQIGLVTDGCIALKRKITIKGNDFAKLNLVLCAGEDEEKIIKILEYYKIGENVEKEFKIARAKSEEEARYLNLSRNNIEIYYKMLPYILHQNPLKTLYIDDLRNKEYKQSSLWKYGISGDIPIILVTVKDLSDIYVVKEVLKVHEMLRVKGIKADLCILDYEKNIYERFVRDQIIQEILNMQIGYLQNVSSGIFLLNANEIEDEDLFKFRANIWINASKGSVLEQLKEMEEHLSR